LLVLCCVLQKIDGWIALVAVSYVWVLVVLVYRLSGW
jgi:hypothetical protein